MDEKRVGRRIRSWMTDRGLTSEQAADALGVTHGCFKGWIYGQNTMGLDDALMVAEFFGKTLDELACRDERGEAE